MRRVISAAVSLMLLLARATEGRSPKGWLDTGDLVEEVRRAQS